MSISSYCRVVPLLTIGGDGHAKTFSTQDYIRFHTHRVADCHCHHRHSVPLAIPQFNQYKIRGYDAHSKQALKDMHLLCNAYWLDTDSTQGCGLPKIKEAAYGFNQNTDVVATLPPSPLDNFCASAKHNSSPNTYSIDSASLISATGDCGKAQAVAIAEKAEAERQAALETAIKKVVAENCCVERAANKIESVGDKQARMAFAGCTNLNTVTSDEQQFCGAYQENSRKEALKGSFETGYPPDCYKVRLHWLTTSTKSTGCVLDNGQFGSSTECDNGAHASDFDTENPDHPCARKL